MAIPRRQRRILQASLIAFASLLWYLAASESSAIARLEGISFDWRTQIAHNDAAAPDDIVVILIDDASLEYMEPLVGRWPWPRSVYADLIDFINLRGPRAIIVDILLAETDRVTLNTPLAHDQRLIEATAAAGNVYHALQFIGSETASTPSPRALSQGITETSGTPAINRSLAAAYSDYIAPIDGLREAAAALGVVTMDTDSDGIIRRTRLFYPYNDHLYPALSVAPLRLATSPADLPAPSAKLIAEASSATRFIKQYRHFKTLSASGVLASYAALQKGDVEKMLISPDEFTGKYVFIGASATGLHDLKATALGTAVPGVLIHAALSGNLLSGEMLAAVPNAVTHWLTALLTIASIVGILFSSHIVIRAMWPVTVILITVMMPLWLFKYGWVIEMAAPVAAVTCGIVISHLHILFTEGRERKALRRMFSRYVSPAALTMMMDRHDEFRTIGEGQRTTATVMFADIRGFTRLSESTAPERVVTMLNHYFGIMTGIIHEHQGTVDKFIGDAIMAIWGAPLPDKNHAEEALKSAMAMVGQLPEINAWLERNRLPTIRLGIGLNTGEVIMGSIGSEQKADYTVIGDSVNLASRLESLTSRYGCDILISEHTFKAITGKIPCRIVDLVRVKGKTAPVGIYTPIDPALPLEQAVALCDLTQEAFDHYQRGDWHQALIAYQRLPEDALRAVFVDRLEHLQRDPPSGPWHGVYTLSEK